MKLLDQPMKQQMEECKRKAREAGLNFTDNTLEYIVTNRDMLELSPRDMIPTLYDYWLQDIQVLRNKWLYEAFPHNPYETVINTRPPISFYNQDNADWFNVMIFYHVLGHIDFDQNNIFFRRTWDDDFCGQALADKRLVNSIREQLGLEKRWVDYVIEFTKAIDNLVGYHAELQDIDRRDAPEIFGILSEKINFYLGPFLKERQETKVTDPQFYRDEIERYNRCVEQRGKIQAESAFFEDNDFRSKFPEFNDVFRKWKEKNRGPKPKDLIEYLIKHSEFLNREKNKWMIEVIQIIRRTSLYFQPQIRTKIANEGWASLWHERLFLPDPRIETHETDYSVLNSGVLSTPRLGINPYAAGKHLFEFIEHLATKGRLSPEYKHLQDSELRKRYDKNLGQDYGRNALFEARKYLDDYLLVNFLSDEDFQDFVDKYKLFVVGMRPSREERDVIEFYIKSKDGRYYRKLLNDELYHPPNIEIDEQKSTDGDLYLNHIYEGRTLIARYIHSVLIGLEFFWGKRVSLETTEYEEIQPKDWWDRTAKRTYLKARVLYTCQGRSVIRTYLDIPPATVYDDD